MDNTNGRPHAEVAAALDSGSEIESTPLSYEPLETVDNSLVENFLKTAFKGDPPSPMTPAGAKRLIDEYRKRRDELRPLIAPVLDKSTNTPDVLRELKGLDEQAFRSEPTFQVMLRRLFRDRKAEPNKEGAYSLDPLVRRALWFVLAVLAIVLGFHFWRSHFPIMLRRI